MQKVDPAGSAFASHLGRRFGSSISATILATTLAAGVEARPPTATCALDPRLDGLVIRGKINGASCNVLLDSGSFELRIQPSFARRSGISRRRPVDFSVAGHTLKRIFPFVEKTTLRDIDAVVGLDVLRTLAVGIDRTRNRAAFWSGGRLDSDSVFAWISDEAPDTAILRGHRTGLYCASESDHYHVPAVVNGQALDFVVDTGATCSYTNTSRLERLHLRRLADHVVTEMTRERAYHFGVADSFTFGSVEAQYRVIGAAQNIFRACDGSVGLFALGTDYFVLDLPGRSLTVCRAEDAADSVPTLASLLKGSGIGIFVTDSKEVLIRVASGSVAANAGFRTGDTLVQAAGYTKGSYGDIINRPMTTGALLDFSVSYIREGLKLSTRSSGGTLKMAEVALGAESKDALAEAFDAAFRDQSDAKQRAYAAQLFELGELYDRGLSGMAQSAEKANEFYAQAAAAGNRDAAKRVAEAEAKANSSVSEEQAEAAYEKGRDYYNGEHGASKDLTRARQYFERAVAGGNASGMFYLGVMYANGLGGLERDEGKADDLYQRSAALGVTASMNNLGVAYSQGRGVAKDEAQANVWFQKAADGGSAVAMYNLGTQYENGEAGLAKDEIRAKDLYAKAANLGEEDAMFRLGSMYEHGRAGLEANRDTAVEWYRKAAAKGCERAKEALTRLGQALVAFRERL